MTMVTGEWCCCWRLMPEKDYQKMIMSDIVSVMPVILISLIGTHDCMQQSLYALFSKVA